MPGLRLVALSPLSDPLPLLLPQVPVSTTDASFRAQFLVSQGCLLGMAATVHI